MLTTMKTNMRTRQSASKIKQARTGEANFFLKVDSWLMQNSQYIIYIYEISYNVPHSNREQATIPRMLMTKLMIEPGLVATPLSSLSSWIIPRPPPISPRIAITLHPFSRLQPQQHWVTLHISFRCSLKKWDPTKYHQKLFENINDLSIIISTCKIASIFCQ